MVEYPVGKGRNTRKQREGLKATGHYSIGGGVFRGLPVDLQKLKDGESIHGKCRFDSITDHRNRS